MEIMVTLREILNNADWDKYCEIAGVNPWCINEGLADGSEEVTLTPEEARIIGLKIGEVEWKD